MPSWYKLRKCYRVGTSALLLSLFFSELMLRLHFANHADAKASTEKDSFESNWRCLRLCVCGAMRPMPANADDTKPGMFGRCDAEWPYCISRKLHSHCDAVSWRAPNKLLNEITKKKQEKNSEIIRKLSTSVTASQLFPSRQTLFRAIDAIPLNQIFYLVLSFLRLFGFFSFRNFSQASMNLPIYWLHSTKANQTKPITLHAPIILRFVFATLSFSVECHHVWWCIWVFDCICSSTHTHTRRNTRIDTHTHIEHSNEFCHFVWCLIWYSIFMCRSDTVCTLCLCLCQCAIPHTVKLKTRRKKSLQKKNKGIKTKKKTRPGEKPNVHTNEEEQTWNWVGWFIF